MGYRYSDDWKLVETAFFEMSGYPIKQGLDASIVSQIRSSLEKIESFEVRKIAL